MKSAILNGIATAGVILVLVAIMIAYDFIFPSKCGAYELITIMPRYHYVTEVDTTLGSSIHADTKEFSVEGIGLTISYKRFTFSADHFKINNELYMRSIEKTEKLEYERTNLQLTYIWEAPFLLNYFGAGFFYNTYEAPATIYRRGEFGIVDGVFVSEEDYFDVDLIRHNVIGITQYVIYHKNLFKGLFINGHLGLRQSVDFVDKSGLSMDWENETVWSPGIIFGVHIGYEWDRIKWVGGVAIGYERIADFSFASDFEEKEVDGRTYELESSNALDYGGIVVSGFFRF
jgi:hypothetical protein